MVDLKTCPVENTLAILGKKWTPQIIGNILHECKRFNDILSVNPGLTSRVLSTRLKNLSEFGIIEKRIQGHSPVMIEYNLTERGHQLKELIFDLAMFSIDAFPDSIFGVLPGRLPHFNSSICLRDQIENLNLLHTHSRTNGH
ncbi:MAG: helix-turn-helix transcriptional regulator [Candidatus Heimdallarchaeota archaeon]|nr:helix-turn-helix transcriptional regulator [Candidatus Heimdallarchaeota archaeon]